VVGVSNAGRSLLSTLWAGSWNLQ